VKKYCFWGDYCSMHSIQVVSFIFSLQYFNDNVQTLLYSRQNHFKTGFSLVSHSRIFWHFKRKVYLDRQATMVDHSHYMLIFDQTICTKKGYHFVNKQFVLSFSWFRRSSLRVLILYQIWLTHYLQTTALDTIWLYLAWMGSSKVNVSW